MEISISTESVSPMLQWLKDRKSGSVSVQKQEKRLRDILSMPDYSIEFERFSDASLPVCTITKEEAVDFFMNFDHKTFSNARLEYKRPFFMDFYRNLDAAEEKMKVFTSLDETNMKTVEKTLSAALPESVLSNMAAFKVILIISIGNSQGYPHGSNLVFDASNLNVLGDKDDVSHVLAHEIHHTFFTDLIPEEMNGQEFFLIDFAFEGLAVHFCNNAETIHKPRKYGQEPVHCMDAAGIDIYDAEFDALFADFRNDYLKLKGSSVEEAAALVSEKYEQLEYTSRKDGSKHAVAQYPTYYLGCQIYGAIDIALGKERLFEALMNPSTIVETYNEAALKLGIPEYRIQ